MRKPRENLTKPSRLNPFHLHIVPKPSKFNLLLVNLQSSFPSLSPEISLSHIFGEVDLRLVLPSSHAWLTCE